MRFIDEFRDSDLVLNIAEGIRKRSARNIVLMEVCGGHTMAVHKFGLHDFLPETVRLISGPGCPVCVSGTGFIDQAVRLAGIPGTVITTYGDLIRVPGSDSSLEQESAKGADVRIVYSVMDALEIARQNPDNMIVFLGIGFETTAPATAAGILKAKEEGISNFKVLCSHKLMPPVMTALIDDGVKIDGYIAPGHVSAITGSEMYRPIVEKYRLGVVISGFEPVDILQSVYMLVSAFEDYEPKLQIQYTRVVKPEGNKVAQELMHAVFEPGDDWWRGLGMIPASGMKIRPEFAAFDAEKYFHLGVPENHEPAGCICGEILKGLKIPKDCPLFATACTPAKPIGACMVSAEGSCAAFYKYRKTENDG
ncbi:MAG: hydrogenase formation protein HypD [Bacteroidetes bacterium]|nr:hydrogenase formation protein HypD [Bacteroidota bacterium]